MWIVFWWLFRSSFTHSNSGKSILEYSQVYGICDIGKYDLIWFDLIWFDLIRHSKSHWKQHSLWMAFIWIHCWFTNNKYFIISYFHSRDADGLRNFVLNYSKYNLVNQMEQSKEQYFILPMTFSRAEASRTWKWKWNGKVLVACKSAVYQNE